MQRGRASPVCLTNSSCNHSRLFCCDFSSGASPGAPWHLHVELIVDPSSVRKQTNAVVPAATEGGCSVPCFHGCVKFRRLHACPCHTGNPVLLTRPKAAPEASMMTRNNCSSVKHYMATLPPHAPSPRVVIISWLCAPPGCGLRTCLSRSSTDHHLCQHAFYFLNLLFTAARSERGACDALDAALPRKTTFPLLETLASNPAHLINFQLEQTWDLGSGWLCWTECACGAETTADHGREWVPQTHDLIKRAYIVCRE